MDNLFSVLYDKITSGTDLVMATIVAAKGSVPRGSGARMLVGRDGRITGTVGGGAVEYESILLAQNMLNSMDSCCRHFILDKNDIADIGMVCGGDVDIFFQYISSSDSEIRDAFGLVNECVISHTGCELIYKFLGDSIAEMSVIKVDGETRSVTYISDGKETKVYREEIVSPEKVFIFGGGHVAQQLVPILARCDFNCVVIEDRKEYAVPDIFENKCDIILVEEGMISQNIPNITENDYVCIMTRGHKDDYMIQAEVLKTKARYIGVIGSRRKVAAVREKLLSDGFRENDINRITSPIGIDIKSETPAEIAVSIAAQLIFCRRGGLK